MNILEQRRLAREDRRSPYARELLDRLLVADFENGRYYLDGVQSTFDAIFTHARSGAAPYFDGRGLLKTAADGVARTDHHVWNGSRFVRTYRHDRSTSEQKLLNSNRFATGWSAEGVNREDGAAFGLNGVSGDGARVTLDTSTGLHRLFRAQAVTIGDLVCFSLAVRRRDFLYLGVAVGGEAMPTVTTTVNLATGAVQSVFGTGHHGSEVVGDVVILHVAAVATATGNGLLYVNLFNDSAQSNYAGDGVKAIDLLNAQVEIGRARPTLPLVSGASPVSLGADTLTIGSGKIPYSDTAMWRNLAGFVDFADLDQGVACGFVNQGSGSDFLSWYLGTSGTDTGKVSVRQASTAGGTQTVNSPADGLVPGVSVPFNIAGRHTATQVNGALNGVAFSQSTGPQDIADLSASALQIGDNGFSGAIRLFRAGIGDIGNAGIVAQSFM